MDIKLDNIVTFYEDSQSGNLLVQLKDRVLYVRQDSYGYQEEVINKEAKLTPLELIQTAQDNFIYT